MIRMNITNKYFDTISPLGAENEVYNTRKICLFHPLLPECTGKILTVVKTGFLFNLQQAKFASVFDDLARFATDICI